MNHGMALLGELHANEYNSCPCLPERASKLPTLRDILNTATKRQSPPSKPLPLSWSMPNSDQDVRPSRHHDTRTFAASPGKAAIGTPGSRPYDTCTNEVSPGKASNDPLGGSHDNASFSQRSAKRHKASAADHPRVWPKEMITIIKAIVELHSPCPDKPLFKFATTSEAAEKNFLILKSFDFDMKRAFEAQANSPMGYGSEFQKGDILQPPPEPPTLAGIDKTTQVRIPMANVSELQRG